MRTSSLTMIAFVYVKFAQAVPPTVISSIFSVG